MSRRAGRSPFATWSPSGRRRAAVALGMAELAQLALFGRLEAQMRRTGGPGIIAFELAGAPERAGRMLARWGEEGRRAARRSLLLDFVFPPTYAAQHALACEMAARRLAETGRAAGMVAAAGGPIAWAQLAAAGFDYVENAALLVTLTGRTSRAPALARRAALVKFGLIGVGWAYAGLGALLPRRG